MNAMQPALTPDQIVQLEARQAAQRYSDLDAACPYPWGSHKAVVFKREFLQEREHLIEQLLAEEAPTESPFCECNAAHSIEERDFNQCDACGKPINH